MAYLTETAVQARARKITEPLRKSASTVLKEETASAEQTFDVFLSHSSAEPEDILLGVTGILKDQGLTVYVDKYTDPHLSPERVTKRTAEMLRGRMHQSRSLLYVYSRHSQKSRWMPWELGFFDGLKGMVGVLPVTLHQEADFKDEEYLSLYPYVDLATMKGSHRAVLWINDSSGAYAEFKPWLRGLEKIQKK